MARSGIVILSGGLGPTEDDLTREAVAQALGRELVFHADIAEALERRFAAMKRKMSEINKRQAFVIEGADVLPNDRGTAPGQWVTANGAVAMLLPGPPHELKAMFEQQCLPRLARITPKQVIRTAFLRITGMPESDLDALISPVYKKYVNVATTILAANGDLQVHLRARCDTESEASALLAEVVPPIESLLGDRLYSRNGDPLEVLVGRLLRHRQATLAVAESCTGGMLGARERTGSTYALSITGVAGPDGGTEEKPVGLVYLGIAGPEGTAVTHRRFIGDRERIRVFTTQAALDLLRRRLQGLA
jgi:nicotinamide-nucleotide amidase